MFEFYWAEYDFYEPFPFDPRLDDWLEHLEKWFRNNGGIKYTHDDAVMINKTPIAVFSLMTEKWEKNPCLCDNLKKKLIYGPCFRQFSMQKGCVS